VVQLRHMYIYVLIRGGEGKSLSTPGPETKPEKGDLVMKVGVNRSQFSNRLKDVKKRDLKVPRALEGYSEKKRRREAESFAQSLFAALRQKRKKEAHTRSCFIPFLVQWGDFVCSGRDQGAQ